MMRIARSVVAVTGAFMSVLPAPTQAQAPAPAASTSSPAAQALPPKALLWAYPINPNYQPAPPNDEPQQVPGSSQRFTLTQAHDNFFSPDWFADSRRPMPDVVARGRKPNVRACGACHRAEGSGGPENASLAGLSAEYIVRQMADFKSGARGTTLAQRLPFRGMALAAREATAAEVEDAARYFAGLQPRTHMRVIESDTVPRVSIPPDKLLYVRAVPAADEPLGERIVELPEDERRFELRDSRVDFVVYAPVGSVAQGKGLAAQGQCVTCHGPDLRGVADVPGIAGRSPSYLARQLHDFAVGARNGPRAAEMRALAPLLTPPNILALTAYLATLAP